MAEESSGKKYDLEDRTYLFASRVREFVKTLLRSQANTEDSRQLIRSSGSIGANYVEANDALSRKDFALRIKICRKEARESRYWLRLLDVGDEGRIRTERDALAQEAKELTLIFAAIVRKCE